MEKVIKTKKIILSDNDKATLKQAASVLEEICNEMRWGQKFTNNVTCQDICQYIDGLNFLIGDDLILETD